MVGRTPNNCQSLHILMGFGLDQHPTPYTYGDHEALEDGGIVLASVRRNQSVWEWHLEGRTMTELRRTVLRISTRT